MTKNLERKKKDQTQERTNRRMPICNPTIQLVVVDLYTKYEVSILNGCGDIFDEKVLRNYGRTDGTTDRCKPVYPPLFQSGGIIILNYCQNPTLSKQLAQTVEIQLQKTFLSTKYLTMVCPRGIAFFSRGHYEEPKL